MAKKASSEAAKTAGGPTELANIERLVALMVENGLSELDITSGQARVMLRRGGVAAAALVPAPAAVAPAPAPVAAKPAENLIEIKSPMVGTFYAAPSPDSEPFVSVGAQLSDETVVCIIEAMKVMNEIKAECRGQIVEVCVKNAQPLEYGQVLFKVKPA